MKKKSFTFSFLSTFSCPQMKVVEYADRLEARAKLKGKALDVQAELKRYREELLMVSLP